MTAAMKTTNTGVGTVSTHGGWTALIADWTPDELKTLVWSMSVQELVLYRHAMERRLQLIDERFRELEQQQAHQDPTGPVDNCNHTHHPDKTDPAES
jgi:hypothetical protein